MYFVDTATRTASPLRTASASAVRFGGTQPSRVDTKGKQQFLICNKYFDYESICILYTLFDFVYASTIEVFIHSNMHAFLPIFNSIRVGYCK